MAFLLKWQKRCFVFGGKPRLAKQLLPLFSGHSCYVELFTGGAALFFLRPQRAKSEVLNDSMAS